MSRVILAVWVSGLRCQITAAQETYSQCTEAPNNSGSITLPDFFHFFFFPEGWRLALSERTGSSLVQAHYLPLWPAAKVGNSQGDKCPYPGDGLCLPRLPAPSSPLQGCSFPSCLLNHSWRAQTSSTNLKQISICKYFLPSILSIFSNSSSSFSWQK